MPDNNGVQYSNPPQSRNEAILESILTGDPYTAPPQSRIEDLLIQIKEAGGGGGTTVIANPEETGSETELAGLQVGSTKYKIPEQTESAAYKDKNVVHMGDSWIELYGLAEGVAQTVGYTVTNCGFQATAISAFSETALLTGSSAFSLIELAKALTSNDWSAQDTAVVGKTWTTNYAKLKAIDWSEVDVLILSYGVNDEGAQNPVGDTSERGTESVCGALKEAIRLLQSLNDDMEIIVTTPCYRYRSPDSEVISGLTERNELEEYRNAIGLTAQSCAVKLIDMRALSGINEGNHTDTLLSDGLHPTELGVQMWVDGFSKSLEGGFSSAFNVSDNYKIEDDNLCFDSEKFTKHKQWNATYTNSGIKYLCTSRTQQFGIAVLGMVYFDSLPTGSTITLKGYGVKTTADGHRIGFVIKNKAKTSDLLDKFVGTQFAQTDGAIQYSFTTEADYTECWVVFYVKQMVAWDNGKALVRDMKCTVTLPST